jgi:hypothetical protein
MAPARTQTIDTVMSVPVSEDLAFVFQKLHDKACSRQMDRDAGMLVSPPVSVGQLQVAGRQRGKGGRGSGPHSRTRVHNTVRVCILSYLI